MGRRVKVEFEDDDGSRYTISLQGSLSRDKVLKIMDIVELLGGQEQDTSVSSSGTVFNRVYSLIDKTFPLGPFSSMDLLEAYEDQYNHPIKLSTVSTYLSRLTDRGILRKERTHSGWIYRRVRLKAKT